MEFSHVAPEETALVYTLKGDKNGHPYEQAITIKKTDIGYAIEGILGLEAFREQTAKEIEGRDI